MGFFTLAAGGIGFVLIGVCEALSSFSPSHKSPNQIQISEISNPIRSPNSNSSSSSPTPSLVLATLLSFLAVLDSLYSFFDSVSSGDRIGSALQLQTLAVAALFLLHGIAGILSRSSSSESKIPIPSLLIDSIALFAFAEEFLLFYLQRKDTSGIENRYYDLILVPIAVCVVSSALGLRSPDSDAARLGRAAGLVLQGTWLAQTAISIHTGLIAHGCSVQSKSRGNFTAKCRGHGEYHRARAIATLQFNCHLALIVAVASLAYSVYSRNFGGEFSATDYRPIEMRTMEQFTLDSDGEDENGEIEEDRKSVVNGHHHH